MPSEHVIRTTKPNHKIALTLILQAHPAPQKSDGINNAVVYSQLKIMQILQSYPDAAVVGIFSP